MSEKIEKLILEYPQKVEQRDLLRNQLRNFKGVTEQEVIDTMTFSAPQGDRVQTSNITDRTAMIGISYRERADRINRDWIEHLVVTMAELEEELDFFKAAVDSLPGILAPFMHDMVMEHMTWDCLEAKYHISRYTVSKYRKQAIAKLDEFYAVHEKQMADYILS